MSTRAVASVGTQVATRFGGGSFLSASDVRLHFGLGHACTVDHVEVWWPSGRHDRYSGLAADTGYKVREGSPVAGRLAGFPAAALARAKRGHIQITERHAIFFTSTYP